MDQSSPEYFQVFFWFRRMLQVDENLTIICYDVKVVARWIETSICCLPVSEETTKCHFACA